MKITVNPKAKRILDIYVSLPQEKRDALEKVIEAYVKENNDESEETGKTS